MDNQPSFDRSLLIPIGVGIFAVLGICVILASGRLNQTRAVVQQVPTATAFQYAFIGTEPAFTTVTVAPSEEDAPTVISVDTEDTQLPPMVFDTPNTFPTNTLASFITLQPIGNTSTPSRTPTSASVPPFRGGTYDDIDSRFVYSRDWNRQSGVSGLKIPGGTLHVSGALGNTVKFLFIGNELHVFFQAGPSLGTIRLTLDSTSYVMNQAASSTQPYEWIVAASSTGTHTVTITHDSGGSVNLDGIIVIEPEPTSTSSP
jgi:hypothetical protein